MWVLGKIWESMESLPLELSHDMWKSKQDIFHTSNASLSLHQNILTPDKIPEFCLPPRLCKRSPLPGADTVAPYLHSQNQVPKGSMSSSTMQEVKDEKLKNGDALVAAKATKKPLPFSAEGYGLAGMYESPNTRRKESLFHSKCPAYLFDRTNTTAAPRLAKETHPTKKTLSGFIPQLLCNQPPGKEDSKNETSSSSLLSSTYSAKSTPDGCLKSATSCPSLIDSGENRVSWKSSGLSLITSRSCPPRLQGSSLTLAPCVLFPLNALQSQERLQQKHILALQGHIKVHLFAEQTISANTFSTLSTVRVHLESVEMEHNNLQTLNYAVNLCLMPGKLQQRESATIRSCESPVFNEDFFFTELNREDMLELQLRLSVLNKPAAGRLRKMKVIGVITKPLSHLLPLKQEEE